MRHAAPLTLFAICTRLPRIQTSIELPPQHQPPAPSCPPDSVLPQQKARHKYHGDERDTDEPCRLIPIPDIVLFSHCAHIACTGRSTRRDYLNATPKRDHIALSVGSFGYYYFLQQHTSYARCARSPPIPDLTQANSAIWFYYYLTAPYIFPQPDKLCSSPPPTIDIVAALQTVVHAGFVVALKIYDAVPLSDFCETIFS